MDAAAATRTRFLDLNAASMAYIEAIGSTAARRLDSKPNDAEHVGAHGSLVFGRMVADLMLGHPPVVGGASPAMDYDYSYGYDYGDEDDEDDNNNNNNNGAYGSGSGGGGMVQQIPNPRPAVSDYVDGPPPLPECLRRWFDENKELSDKIWSGIEA